MPIVVNPAIGNPPLAVSATSSDGVLSAYLDADHAGVLLSADFSALPTVPIKVRFYRGGTLVRSGDAAWAPGGVAVAYDHEAPLGAASQWTAVPIFVDGTTGSTSAPVTLTVPDMSDDVDCWVKPINDPGLSVAFPVYTDEIVVSHSARVQSYAIPGRALPVGTYDRRTPAPVSITLRTTTHDEKDALNAALDTGPVFVQLRGSYGIHDFYAIPGDNTENYFLGMYSPERDVATNFLPCDRPPTLDAPLFIPGHSWDEQLALAPTWDARLAIWPTWWDALHGDLPAPDGLLPEEGGGGDEGGP
jgi:hypothetical protein